MAVIVPIILVVSLSRRFNAHLKERYGIISPKVYSCASSANLALSKVNVFGLQLEVRREKRSKNKKIFNKFIRPYVISHVIKTTYDIRDRI